MPGRNSVVAWMLVLGCYLLYRLAPGWPQVCDSRYSLLVSVNVLRHASWSLDNYLPPGELPYQLTRTQPDGPVWYGYPLGSSVLSLPIVLALMLASDGPGDDPEAALAWETRAQVEAAALVAAGNVAVLFLLARLWLSLRAALGFTLVFALGTSLWSTNARGLWSHTWAGLLLSLTVLILARIERRRQTVGLAAGVGLGALLFVAWWTRTHLLISVLAVGAYLLWHHRRVALAYLLTLLTLRMALMAFSQAIFGQLSPPTVYSAGVLSLDEVGSRFLAVLLSPSRGLLIYTPVLAVWGLGLILYRRRLADTGLLSPALLAVTGQLALLSAYPGWHGGACFGPRYFSDVLPWFFLLGVLATQAVPASIPWRGLETAALAWGVLVHTHGAINRQPWRWCQRLTQGDPEATARDWSRPQFLAGVTYRN